MKLAASLAAIALVASPALAQDNTAATQTTHVTTTRHIHATNVPVHHATYHRVRHHVAHCKRVTRHGKTYCAKAHRVVVKKTTVRSTSTPS
jgi:mRNA-degrading endonuclease toxin of MazEF toxin-antitoxin module